MFGVTLRKGSRDYLYKAFDKDFAGMTTKYQTTFYDNYICNSPNWQSLNNILIKETERLNIPVKMKFYSPKTNEQLSLF